MFGSFAHIDDVALHISGQDKKRLGIPSDVQSFPLTDGIEMGSLMGADDLTVPGFEGVGEADLFPVGFRKVFLLLFLHESSGNFDHVAGFGFQLLLQESGKIDFSDKANSLGILSCGSGEIFPGGDFPDFRFQKVADGKEGFCQLCLAQLTEKITLVLVGIGACKKPVNGIVRLRWFLLSGSNVR